MSRPMLPGQNSKYWGLDLNNYLLSLDRKISELENFHNYQKTLISNTGPGFQNGTWELVTSDVSGGTITDRTSMFDYGVTGLCTYEVYTGSTIQYYTRELVDEKVFSQTYLARYSGGNISIDLDTINFSLDFKGKAKFYAVYLYFSRTADNTSDELKTIFCSNYIFRGDCIMIGTFESETNTFIPRVQSSSKTLYQSNQDTIKPYVMLSHNITNGELPIMADFVECIYSVNGINPSAVVETSSDDNFSGFNYDVARLSLVNKTIYQATTFDNTKIRAYYMSASGNIYTQDHAKPTNTTKDFMIEATDPLSMKDGYVTGGLVFIGGVFYETDEKGGSSIVWYNAKQNGISPTFLDLDNDNPHKILIENNQYWVGNTWYNINVDTSNNSFTLSKKKENNIVISLNNDYCLCNKKLSFNAPEGYRSSSSLYYDYKEEDSALTVYLWDDGDQIEWNWYFKRLDGIFETNKINVTSSATINGDTNLNSNLTVKGEATLQNNVNITGCLRSSGSVIIGTTKSSASLDVYGNTTIHGTEFVVEGEAYLLEGFKTNGDGTYYFDKQGHIQCNDITFTSDIRLKTNLKPINSKICHNAVQNLNVNTYTYIRNNYDTLGLIAQEIEEQLPEYAHLLVHENEDGEKMVSEHKLLFILWEALKQEIKERKGGK